MDAKLFSEFIESLKEAVAISKRECEHKYWFITHLHGKCLRKCQTCRSYF